MNIIISSIAATWTVFGLFTVLSTDFAISYVLDDNSISIESRASKHSLSYSYDRIDEVNKRCASVLNSASEMKPNDNRINTIKEELSFLNGDWWQNLNGAGAPLMPFDDREILETNLRSPSKLVSFWVTDVNTRRSSKKSIFVSGILQMGITLEGLFSEKPYEEKPRFDIWPGLSQLSITFQGIYTETERERVMCLLGSTLLPSREPDLANPWGWVKEYGYTNQPLLTQDDQILLVIHYPKTLSLQSRAIWGTLISLNPKSKLKYFDEIQMSSSLGGSTHYEFKSENLVSEACDPYPFKDSSIDGEFDIYKGLDFCEILERFTRQEALTVLPNYKCNGTDVFCSKLGPFGTNKEINSTDGSFKNVKLVLQDIHCEKTHDGIMRVSSVFRAVPPFDNQFTAAQRTGHSNMTLSAEGIWKSSSGQLCMIGCSGNNKCDSRICLYVPLSFSIKQRSIVLGTLSSIGQGTESYFPLSFENVVHSGDLLYQYTASNPYYNYSKIKEASVVLEKDEPFDFGTVIKKSLLKFPKVEDKKRPLYSLTDLSEDLTLHVTALPDPYRNSFLERTQFGMEILSMGPFFGRYWTSQNSLTFVKENNPSLEITEKDLLLNVSGQINFVGNAYNNFSSLFVEGIYDPHVGKMYLIGCRNVRASWKILYESMDLESGLDCLVEVVISYPPSTARWLIHPTAAISITSQRSEDDPLHFLPIKLQTVPIMYRKQREDILSRRGVEGILRILTLTLAIACILSQIFYVRDQMDSVPYVSLVMLGVQALGYSLPLITGAEALLQKAATEINEVESYDLRNSQMINVIDYTVKLLILVAFLLTLRLCQKVLKSRVKVLARAQLEPHRVPSDKMILWTTVIIHSIGYMIVLVGYYVNTRNYVIQEWKTELKEYLGLVQDFFLLPQVMANLLWRINCKPLRNLYYVGITLVRLLPHVYDFIRSPVPNPYFSEEYEFVNPRMDFFSKFGDIAIPTIAILLAIAVYVQQRWDYDKLSKTLVLGKVKLLSPLGSKVYERLPSVLFEAELVSGRNTTSTSGNQKE